MKEAFFSLIPPLSDHFTHCQLGEDDSVWEETSLLSDAAAVPDELRELGLRAGAVCLLKYAGICPTALSVNVKASHRWWTLKMAHGTKTCLLSANVNGAVK